MANVIMASVTIVASVTYGKYDLWQTYYGKFNYGQFIYGKSIMSNVTWHYLILYMTYIHEN